MGLKCCEMLHTRVYYSRYECSEIVYTDNINHNMSCAVQYGDCTAELHERAAQTPLYLVIPQFIHDFSQSWISSSVPPQVHYIVNKMNMVQCVSVHIEQIKHRSQKKKTHFKSI